MVRNSCRSTLLVDAVLPETDHFTSLSDDRNGSNFTLPWAGVRQEGIEIGREGDGPNVGPARELCMGARAVAAAADADGLYPR